MSWDNPKAYAVKHKDSKVVANSRSGGIFTAVSDEILKNNGVVYGCVLTDKFCATHIKSDCIEDRNRMRGSKYIQSRLGDTFKNVKKDLESGREVLFSGMPCQVDGLKRYLGKNYRNLFCIDIVCLGVPSEKVWKEYLHWQEKRNRSIIVKIEFRDKKRFGWRDHMETLYFENGKVISSGIFRNLFYRHEILRPSCYRCPYKKIMRVGDITIADYWGIEKAAPEFDDNKGVSLLLVNNQIGESMLKKVESKLIWKQTKLEDSMQPPLRESFSAPMDREQFWIDFLNKSFDYVLKKYDNYGLLNKIQKFLNKIKRKIGL